MKTTIIIWIGEKRKFLTLSAMILAVLDAPSIRADVFSFDQWKSFEKKRLEAKLKQHRKEDFRARSGPSTYRVRGMTSPTNVYNNDLQEISRERHLKSYANKKKYDELRHKISKIDDAKMSDYYEGYLKFIEEDNEKKTQACAKMSDSQKEQLPSFCK